LIGSLVLIGIFPLIAKHAVEVSRRAGGWQDGRSRLDSTATSS